VTIDFEARTAVYMQLAQILRQQIDAGEITSRLPSIRTLMQEYGVSQASAVHALAVLRDEGLVAPAVGKGYYVVRP
jgi:DNA-binding GntR family transcriptional regulator